MEYESEEQHICKILNLIKLKQHFVIFSHNIDTVVNKDRIDPISINPCNIMHAIPCLCCHQKKHYSLRSRIKSSNITFFNICNLNSHFIQKVLQSTNDIVYITINNDDDPFIKLNRHIISYVIKDSKDINSSIEYISNKSLLRQNAIFIVNAGHFSSYIIEKLIITNSNNSYIQINNSQDNLCVNNSRKCIIYPKKCCFDISVVLTLYKRPEYLEEQLTAIENQTLKPKEIILFQDGVDGPNKVIFNEALRNRFTRVEIKHKNYGVWERFAFAKTAASPYVCLFDDDTIPGSRWLENCHFHNYIQEGLYGTAGVILIEPEKYSYGKWLRTGWSSPMNSLLEVDFVGHSWFFKKEWINHLFDKTEDMQRIKTAGEDMSFSYTLKKLGIKTFTPPHPKNNQQLWGSLYGKQYGLSEVALCKTTSNINAMNISMNRLLQKNFNPLIMINRKYCTYVQMLIFINKYCSFKYYLTRLASMNRIMSITYAKNKINKLIRKIR